MDKFYMLGLNKGRWFSECFEPYHLFGYIGDREALRQELERKSLARKIIEIVAPRISIASVLNAISEIDLVSTKNKTTIAQDIINLVTKYENQRKVTEILSRIYKKGREGGTYYGTVAAKYGDNLYKGDFNSLQSRLITVEGQLVHRSVVSQYSKSVSSSLGASQQEWLLADYPPHAFVDRNDSFTGKVLLLNEDKGFADAFSNILPFNRVIGWYPYVRITGFFDASKIQTQIYPSLSICFVEYRRPIIYRELRNSLLDFIKTEFTRKKLNYLDNWSDLILFSYLCPIVFKGSNMEPKDSDDELKELIGRFLAIANKSDIPQTLNEYYELIQKNT